MSWLDELHEALQAEIGSEAADRACTLICKRWAGERPYIAARRQPTPNPRLTPQQISLIYSVSPSTAHRWYCRWNRRKSPQH